MAQQQAKSSSSSKRPVGRPPGSKNKLKPPMVITHENYGMMSPIIEVGADNDVMDVVAQLARRRNCSIIVMHAAGTISNVTLKHPQAEYPASFISHGPFVLLGLYGSYVIQPSVGAGFPSSYLPSFIPNVPPSVIHPTFTISVSSLQGKVFSGIVAGKVMAGNNGVTLTALFSQNPEYYNFSVAEGDILEDDIDNPRAFGVSGDLEGASGSEGGGCTSGFVISSFI